MPANSNNGAPPGRGVRLIICGPPRLLPFLLRSACLSMALIGMWLSRGYMDPDGVSYSDVAKALLRGDWNNGLSTYWSPLYSWMLAIGYGVFRPTLPWQIFVSHVINFLGFAASLAAWEWLLREWEQWQGPPAHRALVETTGYLVIAWAGLHLVGLSFTSADMEVLALTVAAGALLVRVASGSAQRADFIWLGIVLGFAFLAKASTLLLVPVVLVELAILQKKSRVWIAVAAAMAAIVVLPFVTALSIAKQRLTFGDAGSLNYSWEVTGMNVEGYKEGPNSPGTAPRHPFTSVMDVPRVISYEAHPVGAWPAHFDPGWWCEGYPVRLDLTRQMMLLRSNVGYSVTRFAVCPAIFFALLCCLCGAARPLYRRFLSLWMLWLPAMAVVGSLCLVYTLNRYFGGAFALLGFCLVAAGWNVRMPRGVAALAPTAMVVLLAVLFRADVVEGAGALRNALRGREDPLTASQWQIAGAMRQQGFRDGDEVGLIGNTLLVPWLHLLNGRAIAVVPMGIRHEDRVMGRPLVFNFEKSYEFWRADKETRRNVFNSFSAKGARWVFASNVPVWADVSDWQVAGPFVAWSGETRPFMYFRKLTM